jgi:hypothetical protein
VETVTQLRARQVSAKELALGYPTEACQNVTRRADGEVFISGFARWRVRPVTEAERGWAVVSP